MLPNARNDTANSYQRARRHAHQIERQQVHATFDELMVAVHVGDTPNVIRLLKQLEQLTGNKRFS